MFQLLLKGCTIEAYNRYNDDGDCIEFQLLLKGCTIEAYHCTRIPQGPLPVSVVVERMYD